MRLETPATAESLLEGGISAGAAEAAHTAGQGQARTGVIREPTTPEAALSHKVRVARGCAFRSHRGLVEADLFMHNLGWNPGASPLFNSLWHCIF